MRQAIVILGLVMLASCTDTGAPSGDGSAALAEAALGAQSHAGIKMTPEIRACRDTCWAATPYNECARQRDVCYQSAVSDVDRRHCRHMSHTCRKTRRKCLQGCWVGKAPVADPLGPERDDDADADDQPDN